MPFRKLVPALLFLTGAAMLFAAADTDFENAAPGKFPGTWRRYQKLAPGQTDPVIVQEKGNRFLRIATRGEKDAPAVGVARNLGATPGQKYRVSFRLRNPDPAVPAQVNFNVVFRYDGSRYGHGKKYHAPLKTREWQTVYLDVEAPDKANELIVELHTGWNRPGTLDADDFKIDSLTPDGQPSSVFGKTVIGPRDLHLETPLDRAAIVAHTPVQKELAVKINAVLAKPLPVVGAAQYAQCRKLDRNLIMLGCAEDNPAIFNLYMRHLVILDSRYPGRGGWNVRTLHDPFADGHNVIFAGGSDEEGHRAAVDALLGVLREHPAGPLPRLALIRYPKADQIRLGWGCEWDGFFGYGPMSRNFAAFYMTGDKKYVDAALKVAFPDKEQIVRNNRMDRYDDGADPIAKPYHYWASNLVLYWDMIEEDPVFSPEVRLKFTRKLYEQMQYWIRSGYGGWYRIYQNPRPHTFLGDRHYMMEALCVYTVAQYFNKYYPSIDSREGLRCAEYVFAPVWNTVTPPTGWRVWQPSMLFPALQYALLADWPRCRTNANFRGYGQYLLALSSLRSGEWLNGFPGLYGAMALVLQDGAFRDMQEKLTRDPDAALIGPAFFSLDREFPKNSFRDMSGQVVHADTVTAEGKHVTEFLSFRSRPDAAGDFLLVSPKSHPKSRAPSAPASIEMLSINGVPVLEGVSRFRFSANGIAPESEAAASEIELAERLGETVLVRTTVKNPGDHVWTRTIFHRIGKCTVIHDRVTPEKAGFAMIENIWQPVAYSLNRVRPDGDVAFTFRGGPVKGSDLALTGRELFPKFDAPGGKRFEEFTGTTEIVLAPDSPAKLRFTLDKPLAGPVRLAVLPPIKPVGKLALALDGKTVIEGVDPAGDNAFRRLEIPGPLAQGEHELTFRADAPKSLWRFGMFTFGGAPREEFTLGTSRKTRTECVPEKLNGPDGGPAIDGFADVFTFTGSFRAGQPFDLATVIRPGADSTPAAVAGNGAAALALPSPALLETVGDGVLLTEPDHVSGVGVRAVPGLFERGKPVAFDYDVKSEKLTVREADGKITTSQVRYAPPANLAERCAAIRRNAAAPQTAAAPAISAVPVRKTWSLAAPVGHLLVTPHGLLAAAGNTLALYRPDGEVWRRELKGKIGALRYWPDRKLLLAGTDAEEIAGFSPEGDRKFSAKSESAPEFIRTNKIYWFKSAYPGVYAFAPVTFADGRERLAVGSTGTVEILRPDGSCEARFQQEYGPVDNFAVLGNILYSARSFGAFPATCAVDVYDGKLRNSTVWMMESAGHQLMDKFGYSGVGKDFLHAVSGELAGTFSGAQNHLMRWEKNGKIVSDVNLGPGGVARRRDYAVPAKTDRMIRGFAASPKGAAAVTAKRLLHLLDKDGKFRKTVPLDDEPFALAADGTGWLVGTKNAVLRFDAEGRPVSRCPVTGTVTALASGPDGAWAGTEEGELSLLPPRGK